MKVKQKPPPCIRHPAVVVHGLPDARAALAAGRAVTLLSAPGAALFAGCGWWRAVIGRARAEYADVAADDVLDCADASGLALGALRSGQRLIVLEPVAPGWQSVASIAASLGGAVLAARPPALDMADRGATRRLHGWLHTGPTGDSGDGVS